MNTIPPPDDIHDDVPTEYDFSNMTGVRGKYYQSLRDGYTIEIHHPDGTTTTRSVAPEEVWIMLDPDVAAYFPNSATVNHALRTLIGLVHAHNSTSTS